MNDLEKLTEFMTKQDARRAAEINAVQAILAALISRLARQNEDPEQYTINLVGPIMSAYDYEYGGDELSETAIEHAARICTDIETAVLAHLP